MRRMGTLYLVRHGQASFGAADYDQLSPLGERQSRALGEWFAQRGVRFEASLRGTLKRHQQTLDGIAAGHGDVPAPSLWPGLNEYDSEAVVKAIHPGPLGPADTPEAYRHHFRLLREGLAAWMAGRSQPAGMPAYADWTAGIIAALDHVRQQHTGDVLLVSSGGPISTAVGQLLGTAPETTIDLNFRFRNSAVVELQFTPKRHMLVAYNHLPHLDNAERADWITFT
jgi:broad specificity phosphatase PhoE